MENKVVILETDVGHNVNHRKSLCCVADIFANTSSDCHIQIMFSQHSSTYLCTLCCLSRGVSSSTEVLKPVLNKSHPSIIQRRRGNNSDI
jgi:hypothetical protein